MAVAVAAAAAAAAAEVDATCVPHGLWQRLIDIARDTVSRLLGRIYLQWLHPCVQYINEGRGASLPYDYGQ